MTCTILQRSMLGLSLLLVSNSYPEGSTSLLELCSAAMWDEAERLLDAGGHSANVSTRNEHGQTPLHIALQNRAPLSVVQKLLLIDPDVCKHHDE